MSDDISRQASALQAMVDKERASALSLTGQRLERELAEVAAHRVALSAAVGAARARIARLLEDCEREIAAQLWQLIVQRESLGLSRHDDVYETYGIPRSVVPRPRL